VQDDFRKEVAIMSTLRHPNVLLFMGACTQPGNLLIVTELMPRGSVYDLLRDRSLKLSLKRKMLFAKDAALGVNWLHRSKPQFLHLDLKVFFSSVCRAWCVSCRVVSCRVLSCRVVRCVG
jgi:serine/threonine protein kinase